MKKSIMLIILGLLSLQLIFAAGTPNNGGTRPYDNNTGKHGTGQFSCSIIKPLILSSANWTNGPALGTFVVSNQAYSSANPTNWPTSDPTVNWTVMGNDNTYYSVRVKDNLDATSVGTDGKPTISYTGTWTYQLWYWNGATGYIPTTWSEANYGTWTNGCSILQTGVLQSAHPDTYAFTLNSVTALEPGNGYIDLTIEVSYNHY